MDLFHAAWARPTAGTGLGQPRFTPTPRLCVYPVVSGGHELIARTTLRQSPNSNDYELKCPPAYEAQIAAYAGVLAVMVDFKQLDCQIKVIGADPTLPFAFLPAADFGDILTVDYDFLPDTTHFLQLEQPCACRDAVLEFLHQRNLV